jgi:hypothetical protein
MSALFPLFLIIVRIFVLLFIPTLPVQAFAFDRDNWRFHGVVGPCMGDCAVSVFGGLYAEDSMIGFFTEIPPWEWAFTGDYIVGGSVSRRILSFRDAVHLEPEIGIAQRFGQQDETEIWVALYFRYSAFPWNRFIYTTVAISTGINYATGISEIEVAKARRTGNSDGSLILHYLSPEITFALPDHRDKELFLRYHHRSGIWGTINGTSGGAQYGTVGFRVRF